MYHMFKTLTLEERIHRRRQPKVYKLDAGEVQLLVDHFRGAWKDDSRVSGRVFVVLKTYLETFETTETFLDGFAGKPFDLRKPDELWYCLKGRVELVSKIGGLNSDPDFEDILVRRVVDAILAFKERGGSTLVAILKGLSLFDSEFNYWLHVDRALVKAKQMGLIVEKNGKYKLKRTKTKKCTGAAAM